MRDYREKCALLELLELGVWTFSRANHWRSPPKGEDKQTVSDSPSLGNRSYDSLCFGLWTLIIQNS